MASADQSKALQVDLRSLFKGKGVARDNLRGALSPDLLRIFEISERDTDTQVRDKVTAELNRVIDQLKDPTNQRVARYSFNITDDPDVERIPGVTARQAELGVFSGRTANTRISSEVLPALASMLLGDVPDPDLPPPPTKNNRLLLLSGGLAVVALIVAAVLYLNRDDGSTGNDGDGDTSNQPAGIDLVFDGLGGGSNTIRVYAGPSSSSQDRTSNGTFPVGERAPAICKTTGRSVSSQPQDGERERTSDNWFKIVGSPGTTQFATGVYTANEAELLAKLPGC